MDDNEHVKDDADEKWNFTVKTPLHVRQFEMHTMLFSTAQTVFWQLKPACYISVCGSKMESQQPGRNMIQILQQGQWQ